MNGFTVLCSLVSIKCRQNKKIHPILKYKKPEDGQQTQTSSTKEECVFFHCLSSISMSALDYPYQQMGMRETVIPNSLETALECILKKAENPKSCALLRFF